VFLFQCDGMGLLSDAHAIRRHERTGAPLGDKRFLSELGGSWEDRLGDENLVRKARGTPREVKYRVPEPPEPGYKQW
jgi:hypothetical protein